MEEEIPQQSRSMNSIITVVVILLLIAGAGIFLLRSKKAPSQTTQVTSTTPAPTLTVATSPAASTEGAMTAQEASFTVHASNFKFDTPTMTVKKGDKVTITFTNDQGFHNFVLDEFNVKTKTIPAGQTDTVSFVADKTGTFEYYCSVANHRAMGMVGKFTVQ